MFTLIKGRFLAKGFSPDGDSLRFKANNTALWNRLQGFIKVYANNGTVQLRYEAIDTLETHYKGENQPAPWARGAADFNLTKVGITNVNWGSRRVIGANDNKVGYVLAHHDGGYGRPAAFVFAGTAPERDGKKVYLDSNRLKKSVNYKLVAAGLAYPMYYETLYFDLRDTFTDAVISAFNAGKGFWPSDGSGHVNVTSQAVISNQVPIYPKLFRRLTEYLKSHGSTSGFKAWLAQRDDRVLVISRGQNTGFDNIVDQNGKVISMTVEPEDLVFAP